MADPQEVEVKFRVGDVSALERKLRDAGFRQKTPPTRELNVLYDLPGNPLRLRGEILRLREYGDHFKLTHKSKGKDGRHKTRVERETSVSNGEQMDGILRSLGYSPIFTYEKFRSEWSDGRGDVVIDRTPIGDLGEIEGKPEWIDSTAEKIGVSHSEYITASYGALFEEWRQHARSEARNMTFAELNVAPPF
jgi:adenylate cyclase, class 2